MTFPCKEEFITFEKLAARQVQLYNDACDIGIPYGDIPDLDDVRKQLNEMLKVFKKPHYDYTASEWGHGRSVEFFIPVENDEGLEHGYFFQVSGNTDRKLKGGGALTIEIRRTARHPKTA
jgi:hypothetical protein